MRGVREKCEDGEGGDDGREIGEGEEWTGGKLRVILSILTIRDILFTHA